MCSPDSRLTVSFFSGIFTVFTLPAFALQRVCSVVLLLGCLLQCSQEPLNKVSLLFYRPTARLFLL